MTNFIEELYYGNIDPQARGYRPKSHAKKASDSLNDLEEKLTEHLIYSSTLFGLCISSLSIVGILQVYLK